MYFDVSSGGATSGAFLWRSTSSYITWMSLSSTGLNLTSNTASTSTTTGALTVAGGVGIVGSAYVGGALFTNGAATVGTGLNTSGTVYMASLVADTGLTDRTLCQSTNAGSVNEIATGTGTLGICLGTSSFAAAKDNIKTIEDGMEHLLSLRPVNYFYRNGYGDNGARRQYGFIAEEYAAVFPDLSRFDADGNATGIDMYGLVPELVSAIQNLKADNDSLRHGLVPELVSAIQNLKADNDSLRRDFESLRTGTVNAH